MSYKIRTDKEKHTVYVTIENLAKRPLCDIKNNILNLKDIKFEDLNCTVKHLLKTNWIPRGYAVFFVGESKEYLLIFNKPDIL